MRRLLQLATDTLYLVTSLISLGIIIYAFWRSEGDRIAGWWRAHQESRDWLTRMRRLWEKTAEGE